MEQDERELEASLKQNCHCFTISTYNSNYKAVTADPVNTITLSVMDVILLTHDAVTFQGIDKISSKLSCDDLRVECDFTSPSDGVKSAIPQEDEDKDEDKDDGGLVLRY
jgi:hypothetical protein